MVFYTQPKRLALKQSDKKASLTNLPDEIQLQIFGDDEVDTLSLLHLRQTNRSLMPACNTLIQERLKVLYLHPRSMKRAMDICNHPTFSQHIEEVVLLGRPMWAELYKEEVNSFLSRPRNGFVEVGRSQVGNRFHAWPIESLQDGQLLKALASLPQLRGLTFAERVTRPGFNQVSEQTMLAHANKCARSVRRMDELRLSDVQVICQLLNDPNLRFRSVCLDNELPFVHHVLDGVNGDPYIPELALLPSHSGGLTGLHITITCGWDRVYPRSAKLHRELVENSCETLEQLTITFTPNKAKKKPIQEYRLSNILDDLTLPRLRNFEIKLVDGFSGNNAHRRHRPTCQVFDIVSFLSRHPLLASIDIGNVFFCDPSGLGAINAITSALEQLRRSSVEVSWRVNKYAHDLRCKLSDNAPTVVCNKFHCGCYQLLTSSPVFLEDFEQLAMNFGVELDAITRSWDFGKAVTDLRNIDSLGAGLE